MRLEPHAEQTKRFNLVAVAKGVSGARAIGAGPLRANPRSIFFRDGRCLFMIEILLSGGSKVVLKPSQNRLFPAQDVFTNAAGFAVSDGRRRTN